MENKRDVYLATSYEPYDNRIREGATGRINTLIHLVKGILGTGVLAMPEAIKNSGLIFGIIANILISIVLTYCLHILFQCMYVICKRDQIPQVTYPQLVKEALLEGPKCLRCIAPCVSVGINSIIIVFQVGVMCIYLLFCASNVKQVIDQHTPEDTHLTEELYMMIILLLLLPLVYIKNLKWLAPFSNIGNWLTLIGLIIIWYYSFKDLPNITERKMIACIQVIPLFMGTAMFSLLSMGAILSIEQNMKEPRHWRGWFGVLNLAMIIVTFLNCLTGFSGYWQYGDDTFASVTLNIDITQILAQIVRILFTVAIYISFALQTYPVTEIFWEQYIHDEMSQSKYPLLWDYILRTILVLSSFLLAVSIPRLGLFISLCGAICPIILGVIFPSFIDLCLRWPDNWGPGKIYMIRDILLIFFGFIGWVFGTYTAVRAIILSFL